MVMIRKLCWALLLCMLTQQTFCYSPNTISSFPYESNFEFNAEKSISEICGEEFYKQQCLAAEEFVVTNANENTTLTLKDFEWNQLDNREHFMMLKYFHGDKVSFKFKNPDFDEVVCLQKVKLTNNNINFTDIKFPAMPNVDKLTITKNTFEVVAENTFTELKFGTLFDLELSGNHIKEFKKQGAKKLMSIDLSHNEIESFEKGVFDDMPRLQVINLDGNRLKSGLTFKRFNTPKYKELDRFRCQCDYELETANGFTADSHGHFVCDDKRGCIGCNLKQKIYFAQYEQRIWKMNDMDSLDEFCPMRVQEKSVRKSDLDSLGSTFGYNVALAFFFVALCTATLFKKYPNYVLLGIVGFFAVVCVIVWLDAQYRLDDGETDRWEKSLQEATDLARLSCVACSFTLPIVLLMITVQVSREASKKRKYLYSAAGGLFVTFVLLALFVI